MKVDAFAIIRDEEELIQYMLESFASLGDQLGILSLVDNNSTDATLEIVDSFRDRMNIVLQHERQHSHHGKLRTMALEPLTAEWVLYLDGDETLSKNFADWLRTSQAEQSEIWEIFKYTTILDCYHYVEGGNGPSQRLFRRRPGVHFPQEVHTEPTANNLGIKRTIPGVYMWDHTACKSWEQLWAKGWRYLEHNRAGVTAVGPIHEYVGRVTDALNRRGELIREHDRAIRDLIFTGPGHQGD